MAKNPTAEQFAQYVADRRNGVPAAKAQKDADLSHSQAEFHWLRTQPVAEGGMAELVGKTDPTPAAIRKLRENGESWGRIAVHCDRPEGTVRKLYAEGTGNKSQGQRIGKGGRFYYGSNGMPLYAEVLKATGTVISVTEKGLEPAIQAATEQRELLNAEVSELRDIYKAELKKVAPKGFTKAQLAIAIRRNRVAKEA
jgi:hypothetical protein